MAFKNLTGQRLSIAIEAREKVLTGQYMEAGRCRIAEGAGQVVLDALQHVDETSMGQFGVPGIMLNIASAEANDANFNA